jgi:hypothetical protein
MGIPHFGLLLFQGPSKIAINSNWNRFLLPDRGFPPR